MITLGLNYSQMHDSSACLVRDGEALFAVAEERISRLKHDARFPRLAIQACFDFAKIRAEASGRSVHGLADSWRRISPRPPTVCHRQVADLVSQCLQFHSPILPACGIRTVAQMRLPGEFGPTKARFRFVEHHLAHALSAYSYSGLKDSAIVVMDGRGAWEATSIWRGDNGRVEHVLTINWPDSLGLFYAQFTGFLGFVPNSDEWKVMGLAPYGQPGVDLSLFIDTKATPYRVHVDRLMGNWSSSYSEFPVVLGKPREPESDISELQKNIAFAVQDKCEEAMMSVVRMALQKCRQQESLPSRRRSAKFQGQRQNCGIRHGR